MNKEVAPTTERICSRLVPKAQAIPNHPERQSPEHDIDGVLHHDVDLIFHRHRAALQQTKPLKTGSCVFILKKNCISSTFIIVAKIFDLQVIWPNI